MKKTSHLKHLFFILFCLSAFCTPVFAQFDNLYKYRLEFQLGADFAKILKTGDLVAFNSNTAKSKLTKMGTLSQYTHVGIIWISPTDSIVYIIHCTNNDYEFKENNSKNAEEVTRHLIVHPNDTTPSGVIMTPLQESIFAGEYNKFFIFPLKEEFIMQEQKLLTFFNEFKNIPFEKSKIQFTLAGIDIPFFETDIFKNYKDDKQLFCSEFIAYLLENQNFIDLNHKIASEYSPVEIVELPIFEQVAWEIKCPTPKDLYLHEHYDIYVPPIPLQKMKMPNGITKPKKNKHEYIFVRF